MARPVNRPERIAFDQPTPIPDGSGGQIRSWVEVFQSRAEFIYQRGSEALEAARLEGRAVYKIKLLAGVKARSVRQDWRLRDVRRGIVYNIREVDAITDPRWVYITAEAGVAV